MVSHLNTIKRVYHHVKIRNNLKGVPIISAKQRNAVTAIELNTLFFGLYILVCVQNSPSDVFWQPIV